MAGSTSAEGDRSHDNGRQAGDAGSEALYGDGRDVARYLTGRESDEYIAIMDVLEASVTELNPSEIAVALAGTATPLTPDVVSVRLERLAECSNVTGTSDEREIKFFQHLLARYWRVHADGGWPEDAPLLPAGPCRDADGAGDSAGEPQPRGASVGPTDR